MPIRTIKLGLKMGVMRRIVVGGIFLVLIAVVGILLSILADLSGSTQSMDIRVSAQFNTPLEDDNELFNELLGLITSAELSIQAAVYHISSERVIEQINHSCARNIQVQIVTEFRQDLASRLGACADLRFEQNERLMHHKFMLVDDEKVWTSSANWTDSSLFIDANNALIFESEAIAQTFRIEFDQMFHQQKYGQAKRDQNRERFVGTDVEIELLFAPSDDPRERLLELIANAASRIDLAVYAMTDDPVYEALRAAQQRGVVINAIWDFLSQSGCSYSEVDEWTKSGTGVMERLPGLLHHKFAVIDDEVVVAGSANWSSSGFEWNDENLVILHSREMARRYSADFNGILQAAMRGQATPNQPPQFEKRDFEYVPGRVLLQWAPHESGAVTGYEICRSPVGNSSECEESWFLDHHSWFWIDETVQEGSEYAYRIRALHKSGSSPLSEPHIAAVLEPELTAKSLNDVMRSFREFNDKQIEVLFNVREVYVSNAGNLFLNAGEDHTTDFTVFIPGCALERFNGSGFDLFSLEGRDVIVSGELIEFNGPEIIVISPWQIRVVN